ncbi:hypothetical protein [Mycobacterium ostraviense]|nr:hypothetical protein [Mycobacterium ostraviense]
MPGIAPENSGAVPAALDGKAMDKSAPGHPAGAVHVGPIWR